MKRTLLALLLTAATGSALAADIGFGVSVSVNEPGLYGRIDIGNLPPPKPVNPQPVLIVPAPVAVATPPQPIYLHVPPGQQKKWKKYCKQYQACGQPVYFVDDGWYDGVYVPSQSKRQDKENKHHGRGHGRGHDKD
jgi:hypothetical protein